MAVKKNYNLCKNFLTSNYLIIIYKDKKKVLELTVFKVGYWKFKQIYQFAKVLFLLITDNSDLLFRQGLSKCYV